VENTADGAMSRLKSVMPQAGVVGCGVAETYHTVDIRNRLFGTPANSYTLRCIECRDPLVEVEMLYVVARCHRAGTIAASAGAEVLPVPDVFY